MFSNRCNFVAFLICLCFFGSVGVVVSYHLFTRSIESNSDSILYEYQYLRRKNGAFRSNFHISSSSRVKEENDFLSFDDRDSDSIFDPKFGMTEYHCYGTCSCGISDGRTSSSIITRGISYLLVSVSSYAAYEKAKSYFNSKCYEELSENCGSSDVRSSVEDCDTVLEEKKVQSNVQEEDDEHERRVYFCFGNCVFNLNFFRHGTGPREIEEVDCSAMKQEGEIEITRDDLVMKSAKTHISQKFSHSARSKFQQYFLVEFCRKSSTVDYVWTGTVKTNGKIYPFQQTKNGAACVGRSRFNKLKGLKTNEYRNVRCRQIHPEPADHTRKYHNEKFWERKRRWDEGENFF